MASPLLSAGLVHVLRDLIFKGTEVPPTAWKALKSCIIKSRKIAPAATQKDLGGGESSN